MKSERTQASNSLLNYSILARPNKKTIAVAFEILAGAIGGSLIVYFCQLRGMSASNLYMLAGAEIAGICGVVLATCRYLKTPSMEELFKALPKSWMDKTPGLYLDATPRETAEFKDSKPDTTGFQFHSLFLHVFYSKKSKCLWFKVYTLDEDGNLNLAGTYKFEKNRFIHSHSRYVIYPSLDSLLDHHAQTGDKPLQRAIRTLEVDIPNDIKDHSAYRGTHQNNVIYQKPADMEFAIIYSIDHKSLLLITDLTPVTFTYNKNTLQYECPSLNIKSLLLEEFVNKILSKCKTSNESSSESLTPKPKLQIKPILFREPKNQTANLKSLFASLPSAWNDHTPGLLLDKTPRDSQEYWEGRSNPDVSGYKYNSILLHVFYCSRYHSLQFHIGEIDEKGNFTHREICSFKDNLLYNANKMAFSSIEDLINFYCPHYRKPARLATRTGPIPVCNLLQHHPAYQGAYHSVATYRKPDHLDFAIIYGLDYESFMIVVDDQCGMSFSYDEQLRFFSEHMGWERYNLPDFLSEALKFLQKQTDRELLKYITRPTGKPNLPTSSELEKLFQGLPEAWKKEKPGLILDKTIRKTCNFVNGQDRADFSQYSYDSIFIYVYYGYGERRLSYHLCTLDKNGVAKPITELIWINEEKGITSFRYPDLYFKSPEEFIDHYQQGQLQKLGLTRRVALVPKIIPEQIATHPNYVGACREFDAEIKNGTFCIAYSLDHESFFVNTTGRIFLIEYDPNTLKFCNRHFKFAETQLDNLISKIMKFE